jgi:hypothetical protein
MAFDSLEIPHTLRALSEQSLKQAHAAYEQAASFTTKAMGAWMDAMPANPMTAGFKAFQGRVMEFALENAESAFTFAGKVCNTPTPQDMVMLQTQFTQERMQAYVAHTQRLFSAMGETLPKPNGDAMSAWAAAAPSNPAPSTPVATNFKSVQERAVAMADKNAGTAAALAEKIANAQNFGELLTLQVRFAEEHMQAQTTQMEELQQLIEEALQKSTARS